MAEGVILLGLNGCGKTTVGRELAQRLHFRRLDAEDYFFLPSKIPYVRSRTHDEVQRLLLEQIRADGRYVLSCVRYNWNHELQNTIKLAVVLTAPPEVRRKRILQREQQRFGSRVLPGGDMYESQKAFLAFAASRGEAIVTDSLRQLNCSVITLDAARPVEEIVNEICRIYHDLQ